MSGPIDHAVIPDVQAKPGTPTQHLSWAGRYLAERKPNVVIQIGDFWDMPSLSSYDRGKAASEGRRYKADVEAGNESMEVLMAPMRKEARWFRKTRFIQTQGNHEHRIDRAADDAAFLEGTVSRTDLNTRGWEVYPFLEVVEVDGVSYSHFFPRSAKGQISQSRSGAPSAAAQVIRNGGSATAGHTQGIDISPVVLGGRMQWGLIAGSFYLHDEGYLTPQGRTHWKGLVIKHDVHKGDYCPMLVDMRYLKRKYGCITK